MVKMTSIVKSPRGRPMAAALTAVRSPLLALDIRMEDIHTTV